MAGKNSTRKTKRVNSEEAGVTLFAADFWQEQAEQSLSNLYLVLGGIGDAIQRGDDPVSVSNRIAHSIEASIATPQNLNRADPMPADIMAAMRLVNYFDRTNGDVRQSIEIPAEVVLKEVGVECDDEGAKRVWEELWLNVLNINECYEDIYWGCEKDGQAFPLEVWDGKEIKGIAFIEPTSVWVGQHITHGNAATGLIVPKNFPLEKLKSMTHALAYQSFVTDSNIQSTNANRVDIRNDRMIPVFAHKQRYERYAYPHIARAARNIMHRQILEEYRRGTIEKFMSQMWLFTVGDSTHPASPTKVRNIRNLISQAAKNRSNALVVDHLVKAENISPKTLDDLLANETFAAQRQLIFADLGFSIFLISGEVPGVSGRGGGAQVDVDLQLAIERWEKHPRRLIKWATAVSKKFAEAGDKELLKHMPKFVPGAIGIKQMAIIKERVMPLLTSGKLSTTTALKDSGYEYSKELANKKEEKADSELFMPAPSFMQGVVGPNGDKATAHGQNGRPTLGQKPQQKRSNDVKAAVEYAADDLEIYASADLFERQIDLQFSSMTPMEFGDWLVDALEREMTRAFQDGFRDWGGRSMLDANTINGAPQGIIFQQNHAQALKDAMFANENPLLFRDRALSYSGAVHYAYMLGVQEAMKDHGATGWVRVLHPELSISGPCPECRADASIVHDASETFFEFHPGGVCTVQSVQFMFGDTKNAVVRVPDLARRVMRRM